MNLTLFALLIFLIFLAGAALGGTIERSRISLTQIWHRFFPPKEKIEYSIGIYTGSSPFEIKPFEGNPVLTKKDVTDRKAAYVADPFIIKVKDLWYMFFEVRNEGSYLTELAYATSKDGFKWEYQKVIQPDSYFQSYPYVFEWKGEYYMIPECSKSKSIRIYKARNFPEEWILESVLIKGKDYVDPSIFRYNNKWWIFASTSANEKLYLFYSDNLKGPWTEHSLNPIIDRNKSIARPGGRVIEYNGRLYRVAQDDYPYYGKQIRVFKIIKLTETEYQEEEIEESPILSGGDTTWGSKGMHQFDAHQMEDRGWLVAVDGYKEVITRQ